jgi:hypothetical protein
MQSLIMLCPAVVCCASTIAMPFTRDLSRLPQFENRERCKEQYRVVADGAKTELLKVDSPAALRIYQALQTKADFRIEPEPLKDALDSIAQRVGIPIVIDQQGFENASFDLSTEVVINTKGLKVREMLDLLSTQCPQPIRYRIRKDVLFVEPHPSTK